MDRSSLKKNMLLKRKNGEVQIKEQGDSEIKGNSIGDTAVSYTHLNFEKSPSIDIKASKALFLLFPSINLP